MAFTCGEGRITTAIDAPDVTSGLIGRQNISTPAVDWSTPARVTSGDSVLTTGHVVEVEPTLRGDLNWEVRSALMLSENRMPPMVAQNLSPSEIVYAAAREAGFDRDQMRIHNLDAVAPEAMWVMAPVRGAEVEQVTRIGPVEFINQAIAMEHLARFSPPIDRSVISSFVSARAVARVAVVGSLIYDAEQEGLRLTDTAVAWLTTRVRYAWSRLPDGTLEHYNRGDTRLRWCAMTGFA